MYSVCSGGAELTQPVLRLDCVQGGSLFESRRPNLLLFSGYRGFFPVVKRPGRDSETLLHLALTFIWVGVLSILPVCAFIRTALSLLYSGNTGS